jgi:hypothetical protein
VYEGEQRLGVKIKSKMNLKWIAFTVVLNLAGCSSIRVRTAGPVRPQCAPDRTTGNCPRLFGPGDNVNGIYWDPARGIRSGIESALAPGTADALLIASSEQIARSFDEEIDKARRDEGRFRAGRGDGGGN